MSSYQRKSLRITLSNDVKPKKSMIEIKDDIIYMIGFISNDYNDNIIAKVTMLNKLYKFVNEYIAVIKSNCNRETFITLISIIHKKSNILLVKLNKFADETEYKYRLKELRDEFNKIKEINDKLYYYYKNN